MHIEDRENHPLERFVFEIEVIRQTAVNMPLQDIEKKFADFLTRIGVTHMQPNPPDCKFSIVTYTTASELSASWVLAEQKEITDCTPSIKPLKSLHDSNFAMQLYVEENMARKKMWQELTE